MILTCPNCETRYNLPDEKIPAGGAKVKCSKCGQVFKAELPPETPEEEVEALLDEESGGDVKAGDDFEETFNDVAAGAERAGEESPDDLGDDLFDDEAEETELDDGSPEGPVDDLADTDDLFDETPDETPDETEKPFAADEDASGDLGDDLFEDEDEDEDEDEEEEEEESGEDDLFMDDDSDEDLFDEDESGDEGLFEEGGVEDSAFGDGLELDEDAGKGSRRSLGCLIILLVVALGLGGAIYFKVWTYMGVNLGDLLKNVPFVGQMFMEDAGGEQAEPGESPAERVRKIELKNVKQYYVPNEKAGNLFVVEGKAVNKFDKPKERIKVEVILYDDVNNVLTSQSFLCGNLLSQFQLQVQTEKEIRDGLASEVGILSNNTFIRPGASTPFMAVFFQPPTGVKEFMVKVVDVGDPE
ncbi:MAG: zinc-ribbon domain-containing protein [Desulfovibrionaceae bacterium]|nr:zinc-ribbon domain-containing protein [Desulfovibrionaceae bacterium]